MNGKCACRDVEFFSYRGRRIHHDDIGVDVVGAWLVGVPVVQHHSGVVDWKREAADARLSSLFFFFK